MTQHRFLNPVLCDCHPDVRRMEVDTLPFLQSAAPETVNALYRSLHAQGVLEGQQVSAAGSPEGIFGVVVRGAFKVFRYVEDGHCIVFEILTAGDFFLYGAPDSSCLKMFNFPDQIASLRTSCFLSMGRNKLDRMLSADSRFSAQFFEQIMDHQVRANERFVHLMAYSAEQKLAYLLDYLYSKGTKKNARPNLIPFNLTRQDLAAMSGITLETASRILSAFERHGLIASGRGWVEVLDLQKIRNRLHAHSA